MPLSPRKVWSTGNPGQLQEELQEFELSLIAELTVLGGRRRSRASTQDTVFASYGDVARLSPTSAGQALVLPPAVPERAGATVEAIIESDDGAVTVEVVDGLINEEETITLTARICRVLFTCSGAGWFAGPALPQDLLLSVLASAYPVGSIYISTNSTNPATSLGFGTWSAFGAGRVPVGFDSGQTEFDADEETGGSKTHTLTESEMPSHTHVQDAHNHTQNAHTHTQNAHTHTQNSHTHAVTDPGHEHGIPEGTTPDGAGDLFIKGINADNTPNIRMTAEETGLTVDSATATNQNATATNQNATATNQSATATNQNTGGGGAHNNLQPYIVVRMWKRTA